jgi:3-mercaptopyruvate sulfurtransferase SseA
VVAVDKTVSPMKHIYIISLGGLILLTAMFFIVAAIQANNKYKFKKTAHEMLMETNEPDQFINIEQVKERIDESGNYELIDIRTPKEFVGFHINGAINIPFERLLDESHEAIFRNNDLKILYGSNSVSAHSAWMLLTQYGYENIRVMNGGIREWQELSNKQDNPPLRGILDEKPAYDYADIMEGNEEN